VLRKVDSLSCVPLQPGSPTPSRSIWPASSRGCHRRQSDFRAARVSGVRPGRCCI